MNDGAHAPDGLDAVADRVISEHCAEMPPERKKALHDAIVEAMAEWGAFCSDVAAQSMRG